MNPSSILRRSIPLAIIATAIAAPTLAFSPTVTVVTGGFGYEDRVTDLAGRGGKVAISMDVKSGADDFTSLAWSTDHGATWDDQLLSYDRARESQATWCAGRPVMVFAEQDDVPGTEWLLWTFSQDPDAPTASSRRWTHSGIARKPDVACVANTNYAIAWFQKQGGAYRVKLQVETSQGESSYSQSFDLGGGSMARGLAIATTATRLYVTWFNGDALKLRRFSIGSGSNHSLSSLGTATIASLPDAYTPQIGADGDRVVVAYMHRADLKVRKSSNKGVSFGSAKTLIDKPFPSESGARPTTVAVRGSRIVIGAIQFSELSGKGVGLLSTNGGSSYTRQPSHAGGRLVAGLVKVGSTNHYAEAWDESFSDPSTHDVEFLRK